MLPDCIAKIAMILCNSDTFIHILNVYRDYFQSSAGRRYVVKHVFDPFPDDFRGVNLQIFTIFYIPAFYFTSS